MRRARLCDIESAFGLLDAIGRRAAAFETHDRARMLMTARWYLGSGPAPGPRIAAAYADVAARYLEARANVIDELTAYLTLNGE